MAAPTRIHGRAVVRGAARLAHVRRTASPLGVMRHYGWVRKKTPVQGAASAWGGASYGADAFVGGEEQGEGAGADVGAGDGLVAHGEDLLGRMIAL